MLRHIELLYLLIATKWILSEGGDVPIGVNGLINQSILLSPSVDSTHPVQNVYWIFQTHIMATYINNQLIVIEDTFKGRLEILDKGRSLRIGELRLEDSGLYSGTITFTDKSKEQKIYNLTVYDYVPVPSITFVETKKAGEWCNMTLRCSISTNTSALSYIWNYKHGNASSTVNTGDTIQMSLQPVSWDMEIMCIVHNPADRKNVSVQKICPDYKDKKVEVKLSHRYYAFFAVPIVVVPLVVLLGWKRHKKKKKLRKDPNQEEEEIHYAELRLTPPSESQQIAKKVRNLPDEIIEDPTYSTFSDVTV